MSRRSNEEGCSEVERQNQYETGTLEVSLVDD